MWKITLFIVLLSVAAVGIAVSLNQPEPLLVDTVTVRQGDINTAIDLVGRVVNDQTVTLTALLDGEITRIMAREGDAVNAGAILALLDNRHAVAMRDKARAELAYQIQSTESARKNYNRLKKVATQGNASRQTIDDSLIKLRSAEAAVKIAEAELAISELMLENAEITAPFDSTVIEQTVETGQWVEAGTHLYTLVASDGDVIEVQIDAGDARHVRIGQNASISSEAWPDHDWASKVSWIAPAVTRSNNQPGNTFAVRLETGKSAPELMLGAQLDVALVTDRREQVLLVPIQALQETSPGQYRVHVIDAGTARAVAVKVGLQSINQAQIISGLNEGESVILPLAAPVQHGASIRTR